jgi:uncharacterized repeat protein (TIGR03803 family)
MKIQRCSQLLITSACAIAAITLGPAVSVQAQTFKTLVQFNQKNGGEAFYYGSGALIQGLDGNLYGTASGGGLSSDTGTVYKMTPEGKLTTLYEFCAESGCPDGQAPGSALVQTANGELYGTTYIGGVGNYGTIFEITPSEAFNVVLDFAAAEGGNSDSALVLASNGNLYGTTPTDGTTNYGTVYEITPAGAFTLLHTFCSESNCADGGNPNAGLVQGSNGNFYGTTRYGGANSNGTIFEIMAAGTLTTLYNFCSKTNCTDGGYALGTLVVGANGNLYGTTGAGGTHFDGTIFEITPTGRLSTLYNFCSQTGCADGSQPWSALVQANDGNLYGTTAEGGTGTNCPNGVGYGCGTIFELTSGGVFSSLHNFNGTDGSTPFGGLVQSTNGSFYGTTYLSGTYGSGTIFSLTTGLSAFVKPQPALGKVGSTIVILGNGLGSTTGVKFNGTPAAFTVVSPTELKASVPAGATSGTITVTTATTTLNSNPAFHVAP